MKAHETFCEAVDALDLDKMMSVFADDAILYNPFYFEPFTDHKMIRLILGNVMEVFEEFEYVHVTENADGTAALIFKAKVAGLEVQGLDLLVTNDAGEVVEFTVMVRPKKAAEELHRQMTERMTKALSS